MSYYNQVVENLYWHNFSRFVSQSRVESLSFVSNLRYKNEPVEAASVVYFIASSLGWINGLSIGKASPI